MITNKTHGGVNINAYIIIMPLFIYDIKIVVKDEVC